MPMKTYPMKVEDGKVYAEVTLRDVVERCDVSGLPMLAEVKRLYDENAKLREQVEYMTPIALYAASEHERDRMRELGIEVPS